METLNNKLIALSNRAGIPVSVLIELTNRCNARCKFCYTGEEHKGVDLPFEFWDDVLRQLADLGTFVLTLSGGDPLLYKDIKKVIEKAGEYNFKFQIYTNGFDITEDLADAIADSKIFYVGISINSSVREINDEFMGYPDALSRSLASIKMLRDRSVRVSIKHQLTCYNFPHLIEMEELAADLNCRLEHSPVVSPTYDGDLTPNKYNMSDVQLRKYVEYVNKDVFAKETEEDPCYSDMEHTKALSRALPCGAGRTGMAIGWDGKVYPCVILRELVGDAKAESLKSIWKGEKFEDFREIGAQTIPECEKCEYLKYCARCQAHPYIEEGTILTPPKIYCKLTKIQAEVLKSK